MFFEKINCGGRYPMKKIYWVGIRQSDIDDINFKFAGSITIYGDNTAGNIAYCQTTSRRINHNIANSSCNKFFQNNLEEICHTVPDVLFLFYNFHYAYQFNNEIQKRTIGLNSFELLDMLSDKIRCRMVLNKFIDSIPFITLKGTECSFETIHDFFSNTDEYVIQKKYSSGGEGTYIIRESSDFTNFNKEDEYMVSPYFKNAISINIHIATINCEVVLFPPSIQIVTGYEDHLLYQGADFICYDFLSDSMKRKVELASREIGAFLIKKGYKGVLGIDFLIYNHNVYFMEINPRFQASSQLVNKGLIDSDQPSLFEIHMQAFGLLSEKEIKKFTVPYCNYVFTANNISISRLKRILNSDEVIQIQMDGFIPDNTVTFEKNAFLCRCIFKHNICALNGNKLNIHPNFFVEEIAFALLEKHPYQKEYIKFALLNHGATLSKEAILFAKSQGIVREAVFDAIDIIIFKNIAVNVPVKCKFVSLSPFIIRIINNRYILFWDETEICEITISFMPDSLVNKTTTSGVPYDAIINLANDRIRINPAPICVYKHKHIPCKFCNLPCENVEYNIDDITEIIDYCLNYVDFRHFLIGDGTYSVDGGWEIIIKIAQHIRSSCDKEIYLMSIPPKDVTVLNELKEAGITEVAFNLEIFDRNLAKEIMPGKGNIDLQQYLAAFKNSVRLWGVTGCVRSLLIYGFDADKDFLLGIEELCKLGVEPIISIFRPLENTGLVTQNPPATLDIFYLYQKCQRIVQKYSMILGPDCPQCQNNTLSYHQDPL